MSVEEILEMANLIMNEKIPYRWGVPEGGVSDCSGLMASPGEDTDDNERDK